MKPKLLHLLFVMLFVMELLGGAIPVRAATTITVTTTQDVIANDGLCSLREAVIAANTDSPYHDCPAGSGADTIEFDAGLPLPATFVLSRTGANENLSQTGDLDILQSLTISGSGSSNIILDGNLSDRVFEIHPGSGGAQNLVTIHDVTIKNGNPGAADGGGVLVDPTARLTLNSSEVISNTATTCASYCGGGIKVFGLLTLNNSTILNNDGGGVHNDAGLLIFTNVIVTNNTSGVGIANLNGATMTFSGGTVSNNQGGGIYNKNSSAPTLTNLSISGNTNGSGLENESTSAASISSFTLSNSTVTDNSATSGAGVLNTGAAATATIQNTQISDNSATSGGGGINNSGSLTLARSTLDHNQARSGGGIDHNGYSLQLTNVTISQNTATDNGGGLHNRSSATILNSTFYGNSANGTATGGNVFNDGDTAAISVKNSIVTSATSGGNCANDQGVITSQGHNLESMDTCGFHSTGDIINTDPMLGLLQDNGGQTNTHALLSGSPAINAGTNSGCPTTDQRGVSRPQGALCDIGAYEMIVGGEANLGITKSDSFDPVLVGQNIVYTLNVTNSGPDSAQNVVLIDDLPDSLIFQSATPGQGNCDQNQGVVTCYLGTIASGVQTSVQIVAQTTTWGIVTNNASISSDTTDPNPSNNSASEDTMVEPIEIFLPIVTNN